jgi:hypothetical protein
VIERRLCRGCHCWVLASRFRGVHFLSVQRLESFAAVALPDRDGHPRGAVIERRL